MRGIVDPDESMEAALAFVRRLGEQLQEDGRPWVNEINVRVEAALGLWEPPRSTREDMEITPEQAAAWLEDAVSVEGPNSEAVVGRYVGLMRAGPGSPGRSRMPYQSSSTRAAGRGTGCSGSKRASGPACRSPRR